MKMTKADVVWTPTYANNQYAGSIRVEEHMSGWKRTPGDMWMSADNAVTGPWMDLKKNAKHKRALQLLSMFVLFNTITVRDGIDVGKAHKAFLAIDEYRQVI